MNRVCNYLSTQLNSAATWVSDHRPQIVSKANQIGASLIGAAAVSTYLGSKAITESIHDMSSLTAIFSLTALCLSSTYLGLRDSRIGPNSFALADIAMTALTTKLASNYLMGNEDLFSNSGVKALLLGCKFFSIKYPGIFETPVQVQKIKNSILGFVGG